jgi:acyl-coenzyme A thioesterase PaaI-like protein
MILIVAAIFASAIFRNDDDKGCATVELKLNIVRPLTDRIPLKRADGKLYAHASTTCFIFDTP